MDKRTAEYKRTTKETNIYIKIDLDGSGISRIETPVGFMNHMLEQVARHGSFNLEVKAEGDTEVDYHHLVEDLGICLGYVFKEAIKDFSTIKRYGTKIIPMDEALSLVAVDISNRPYLVYDVNIKTEKIGEIDSELFEEFFKAFSNNLKCNLHIKNFYGKNSHHIIESIFKAFSYSLNEAASLKNNDIFLSTKGAF